MSGRNNSCNAAKGDPISRPLSLLRCCDEQVWLQVNFTKILEGCARSVSDEVRCNAAPATGTMYHKPEEGLTVWWYKV